MNEERGVLAAVGSLSELARYNAYLPPMDELQWKTPTRPCAFAVQALDDNFHPTPLLAVSE